VVFLLFVWLLQCSGGIYGLNIDSGTAALALIVPFFLLSLVYDIFAIVSSKSCHYMLFHAYLCMHKPHLNVKIIS
jgi:hypothetical protein